MRGRARPSRLQNARPTRREMESFPDRDRHAPADTAVCDFCCVAPARWDYPCATFKVLCHDGTVFTSLGGWGACDACRKLVEDEQNIALLVRVMVANIMKGICPPHGSAFDARSKDMLRTLKLFFQNRLGPAEVYR